MNLLHGIELSQHLWLKNVASLDSVHGEKNVLGNEKRITCMCIVQKQSKHGKKLSSFLRLVYCCTAIKKASTFDTKFVIHFMCIACNIVLLKKLTVTRRNERRHGCLEGIADWASLVGLHYITCLAGIYRDGRCWWESAWKFSSTWNLDLLISRFQVFNDMGDGYQLNVRLPMPIKYRLGKCAVTAMA